MLDVQRRSYFNGAASLLCGLLFHCLVTRTLIVPLVVSQLLLASFFLWMGVGFGRGLSPNWAGVMGACLGLVAGTLFVHWSGGPNSPYFHVFGALPFMLALFTPSSRMATVVSGVATLLAVELVGVLAHLPPQTLLLQAFTSALLMSLALFGTSVYGRVFEAQQEAHQERLRALDQLAESERLPGRAERERAEVERLVLVGQLAAGVAHEVNNPLAFVKANLSFLENEASGEGPPLDRAELQQLLAETQQGVLRIQQIVTDLKDFSRTGQLDEEARGALTEALQEAKRLASVRLGTEGEVSLELDPGLPAVRLGQRHVVQVMVNLLLNAADAVTTAQPPRHAHIRVSARRLDGEVRVQVEDNGPGIPPEVLPRLFEPFFTTKPPGKGNRAGARPLPRVRHEGRGLAPRGEPRRGRCPLCPAAAPGGGAVAVLQASVVCLPPFFGARHARGIGMKSSCL